MKKELILQLHKSFEDYAQNDDGIEFWFGRDLQSLLGYAKWENFSTAIEKGKQSCITAKNETSDHFPDVRKMVDIGSGTQREIAESSSLDMPAT